MQQSGDPLRIQVFNTLEDAILNGSYKEGDSLNELRLSKSLGVSRTPVREALMQLELEGLVKNIPNKGAVVVGISEQDVEDIYEIRIRTEGLAARLCAEKITDEELEELEQCMALQEYYLKKQDSAKEMGELDGEFHRIIFAASKSRPLQNVLTSFHNYIRRARAVSVCVTGRAEESVSEHRAILEAITKHDGELAEKLTAEQAKGMPENQPISRPGKKPSGMCIKKQEGDME